MIHAVLDLPAHLRERLASALESGLLSPPYTSAALLSLLGGSGDAAAVHGALEELERVGVTPAAAAVLLRSIDAAHEGVPRIDLVWSGPEVPGLHARDTRRVYEELLEGANRSVWVSTYAFFDGPRAFETIARRLDRVPALRVTLLLNIQRKRGDTTASAELVRRFADRFWSTEWPGELRPAVFYDPRALEVDGPTGVLHAKAVVVDDKTLFVTSANLTEAALDRNIELGLVTRDRTLALTVAVQFRTLIDQRLLVPLPAS
jgi:phosphatidylserine/phosphatidylglycerophosphate/cardiolipin synthase-like enzyme